MLATTPGLQLIRRWSQIQRIRQHQWDPALSRTRSSLRGQKNCSYPKDSMNLSLKPIQRKKNGETAWWIGLLGVHHSEQISLLEEISCKESPAKQLREAAAHCKGHPQYRLRQLFSAQSTLEVILQLNIWFVPDNGHFMKWIWYIPMNSRFKPWHVVTAQPFLPARLVALSAAHNPRALPI